MDNLNEIAVFVRVVESGSFTAAAERLSVSKSVVSKHVTRLENRLGARLLHRTTRRLSLTEVGRAFYEKSHRALRDMEEAEDEVAESQSTPRGMLKLNVPMSFGILHVAPALPEFLGRYPEVTVDMNLDDHQVDVIDEGYDLTIRISDLPDSSLIARRLGPCRHVVVAAHSYLEQMGTPNVPDDLVRHNVVTYRHQSEGNSWIFRERGGGSEEVAISGSLQLNNSLAIREAVLNGAGIARTPTFVVGRDLREGRLVSILSDYETLEVPIYVVYAQRQYVSAKVRAFLEFFIERISDHPYWDRY